MHRAAFVLLACCGSTSSAPSAPAEPPPANKGPEPIVLAYRVLHLHDGESNVLELEQLTIDGTRASFVIGSKTGGAVGGRGPMDGMYLEGSITMTGTAERKGSELVLELQRPDPRVQPLVIGCREELFDVAPANAMIKDPGCSWSVPAERVKVFACTSMRETQPYAPGPGIEKVETDGDSLVCQTPMYRRVPADGSVTQAVSR